MNHWDVDEYQPECPECDSILHYYSHSGLLRCGKCGWNGQTIAERRK